MHHIRYLVLACLLACGACKPSVEGPADAAVTITLAAARQGFTTRIVTTDENRSVVPTPPPDLFDLIRYRSSAGELAAHVTVDPGDGAKHPAIVWITGGDCNTIGESWIEGPAENEQSAAAYRKAGIIMLFPSLRGGNENPGRREGFYGEVDDVLAAADYLAGLSYVDPQRIYLGGHSTGGTLALLVAELSGKFRATFAFGPVADVRDYGGDFIYYDPSDRKEAELRAPVRWLDSVTRPLFVIEGAGGNADSLRELQSRNRNPLIKFFTVAGRDHFEVLAPTNQLIAAKILADRGEPTNISISAAEARSLAASER